MSCENPLDEVTDRSILARELTCQQGENLGIRETNEPFKGQSFGRWRVAVAGFQIADQQVIDLPHASAAAPAKAVKLLAVVVHVDSSAQASSKLRHGSAEDRHSRRAAIIFLTSAIARAGFRSFGQALVQLMIV